MKATAYGNKYLRGCLIYLARVYWPDNTDNYFV